MKSRNTLFVLTITFLLTLPANFVAGTPLDETPAQRKPEAIIDHLATKAGAQLVRGEWRYSDTKIVEVAFKAAGADGQPTGAPNKTYDFAPHAGSADATLSNGKVFFDMTSAPGEDALDGMKVDRQGNLYVSGTGGLWIISPAGKHLGTIVAPKHPHNLAWGGEDGKNLYLTAQSAL